MATLLSCTKNRLACIGVYDFYHKKKQDKGVKKKLKKEKRRAYSALFFVSMVLLLRL